MRDILGRGGGSALWAMFGNSANWSRLGDLMGHPKFEEMMSDFNTLVQENPEAFKELGSEGIEDIIEQYLEDPDQAREAAKELIKEQEEKKKKAEEDEQKPENQEKTEEEKEKAKQLTAEEINDKFKPSKSGKPEDVKAVLGNMVAWGLGPIHNLTPPSFFDSVSHDAVKKLAKNKMNEYIEALKEDVEKEKRLNRKSPKQEFLDLVDENKRQQLVGFFADLAVKSYEKLTSKMKFEDFSKIFADELESSITKECSDGENCDATGLSDNFKVGNAPKGNK